MSDIATELGVTESRVSQLVAEALRWMRDGMSAQSEVHVDAAANSCEAARRATYRAATANRTTLSGRLALTGINGDVLHQALSA